MPHVAFEPSIVLKPILTARSTPDRGAAPPFESLLDSSPADNRPAANNADTPATARNDNKASSSDRSDSKTADTQKTADKSNPADTKPIDPSAGDKAPAGAKAKDGEKTGADAKSETKTKTAGKAAEEVASDGKPAADAKPADPAATGAVTPAPTLPPAVAAAVPAVVEGGPQATIGAVADTDSTIAKAGKGKAGKAAAGQPESGKDGDEAKAAKSGKTDKPTDDKAQIADPEKAEKADAGARGEAKTTVSHPTPADTAPAANTALDVPKADATQAAALAARTQAAAPAAAVATPAALAAPAAAIPLEGVAVEITSKALSGTNHFDIRLDPPDLGRIEVRLSVDRDGTITTSVVADRSDTLDLLRRDSAGLDRAMQDAGLKTSDNGTQFSLRDQSTNQQQQQSGTPSQTARLVVEDETLTASTAAARDYSRLAGQRGGVDISV